MDEVTVVESFCRWLESQGWAVTREADFCDVIATRDDEKLFAEARGTTSSTGVDIDTAYGQLLRRMPFDDDNASFGLVVPEHCEGAALRVAKRIRTLLRITVYTVSNDGAVRDAENVSLGSPKL